MQRTSNTITQYVIKISLVHIKTRKNECVNTNIMGVASNEAEEAGASSLFCVRTHARVGDVL